METKQDASLHFGFYHNNKFYVGFRYKKGNLKSQKLLLSTGSYMDALYNESRKILDDNSNDNVARSTKRVHSDILITYFQRLCRTFDLCFYTNTEDELHCTGSQDEFSRIVKDMSTADIIKVIYKVVVSMKGTSEIEESFKCEKCNGDITVVDDWDQYLLEPQIGNNLYTLQALKSSGFKLVYKGREFTKLVLRRFNYDDYLTYLEYIIKLMGLKDRVKDKDNIDIEAILSLMNRIISSCVVGFTSTKIDNMVYIDGVDNMTLLVDDKDAHFKVISNIFEDATMDYMSGLLDFIGKASAVVPLDRKDKVYICDNPSIDKKEVKEGEEEKTGDDLCRHENKGMPFDYSNLCFFLMEQVVLYLKPLMEERFPQEKEEKNTPVISNTQFQMGQ